MAEIYHNQICFRAEILKSPKDNESDRLMLIEWTKDLINKVDMKIVIGPHFYYVNALENTGWTGSCNIETSHFAIHVWDKPLLEWLNNKRPEVGLLQADLYTCGKFGPAEINKVFEMVKVFEPIYYEYLILDRAKKFYVKEHQEFFIT